MERARIIESWLSAERLLLQTWQRTLLGRGMSRGLRSREKPHRKKYNWTSCSWLIAGEWACLLNPICKRLRVHNSSICLRGLTRAKVNSKKCKCSKEKWREIELRLKNLAYKRLRTELQSARRACRCMKLEFLLHNIDCISCNFSPRRVWKGKSNGNEKLRRWFFAYGWEFFYFDRELLDEKLKTLIRYLGTFHILRKCIWKGRSSGGGDKKLINFHTRFCDARTWTSFIRAIKFHSTFLQLIHAHSPNKCFT